MAALIMALRTVDEKHSDAWLMKQLALGETECLGELYLRYGNGVLRLINSNLGGSSTQDAEDLCQEAFLTLSRTAGRYEEMGKLKSWIFRIAMNTVRDFRKKHSNRSKLMRQYTDEQRTFLRVVDNGQNESSQTRKQVGEAIAKLSDDQREVLMLAIGQGMSGQEISETMGISHNAVRARLHRARCALQQTLRKAKVAGSTGEKR